MGINFFVWEQEQINFFVNLKAIINDIALLQIKWLSWYISYQLECQYNRDTIRLFVLMYKIINSCIRLDYFLIFWW